MKKLSFSIILALLAMIVFWSITPVAVAFVKNEFSLMFQIWMRYIAAVAFLWTMALFNPETRKELRKFKTRFFYYWKWMTLCAAFTILFQLLFTYCFFLISPAFGVLLYQSQVLFSLILGVLFFRSERMLMKQFRTILGMLFAVAGAVVVILFQSEGVELSLSIGIFMALGAALAWSFVGVSLRKGLEGEFSPVFIVTMVFSLIVIYLTPVTLLSGDFITGNPRAVHWFFLFGSGLLGIAGGQGIYYRLLPRLGLVTLASVQLLVPFFTGIFSFLLFREKVTPMQVLGGLILLGGCRIILVQKSKLGQIDENTLPRKEVEAV